MAESAAQEQHSQSVNGLSQAANEDRADALIAAYIEPHPTNPGIAEYRLRVEQNGYPVWAIIGDLTANGENIAQVAHDYEISLEAIQATRAFYARHQNEIDARLAANDAA